MPRLTPKKGSVTVRMYRQGHGDCFLLAFPRKGKPKDPVYVLIDCGYKPGSPDRLTHPTLIDDVVADIHEATGGSLDIAVITHEHQDHCNGIWKKHDPYFQNFEIQEAWFAWTESPTDDLAKKLRKRHHDQLLGLIEARHQLQVAMDSRVPLNPTAVAGTPHPAIGRLDTLLGFELGGDGSAFDRAQALLAVSSPENSVNKQAIKLFKDKAGKNRGPHYWSPGGDPIEVPDTNGVKVYVLGPPKNADLLADEDPVGAEGFGSDKDGAHGLSFAAAASLAGQDQMRSSPFREEFHVKPADAFSAPSPDDFFAAYYGKAPDGPDEDSKKESSGNAAWRRIDEEWLFSAENLALKLNTGINNTSLVLAFELPKSKKVLLFAADAQRGNWISWADCEWSDGKEDRCRDLLARTVLYKVGHHGSHNATLNGDPKSKYANLSWMGTVFPGEFTAMITAVNKWALEANTPPWRHPLPAIRKALLEKTEGRLFQTDRDRLEEPDDVTDVAWNRFKSRLVITDMYFDYTIQDEASR